MQDLALEPVTVRRRGRPAGALNNPLVRTPVHAEILLLSSVSYLRRRIVGNVGEAVVALNLT
jgi:hypothetical protein